MKQFFFLLALVTAGSTQAQNIKLNKGQKLTINTSTTQSIDMGMGGQMQNDSKSSSVVEVKDLDKNNYYTSSKLLKLSMNMEGMGQTQSFDSEKQEDLNSEMGKELGSAIGKEVKISVDNSNGKIKVDKPASPEKKEDEDNPIAGLMSMFGDANSDGALVDIVFFVIPQGKKTGDTWMDSSEVKNKSKVYKTYTLKEMNAEVAKIGMASKMNGSTSAEVQGMQMDVTINTKSNGDIILDPKTSIVKKIIKTTDVEGTMEVMGQSIPLTSKVNEEITID